MIVTLYCTDRGTHDPVTVYVYDGPVPVPDGALPYARSSVLDLNCDRAKGGCRRSPRPSETDLRKLIEDGAATPDQTFDVSWRDL